MLDVSCRIRPGHAARVVNISRGGLLVALHCRLAPGALVELHLDAGGRRILTQAAVVRCCVAELRSDLVLYHGGLRFDTEIAWL